MTITKDRSELYASMSTTDVEAIDEAYDAAIVTLKSHGLRYVSGDDRAENLVGAIARYVQDCKESNKHS